MPRDLTAARLAFERGDGTASRSAHAVCAQTDEPGHSKFGSYYEAILYNFISGILISIGLIIFRHLVDTPSDVDCLRIIVLCAVVLGLRELVHLKMYRDQYWWERKREQWCAATVSYPGRLF